MSNTGSAAKIKIVKFGRRGASVQHAPQHSEIPSEHLILGPNRTSPWMTASVLMASDVVGIFLAWCLAFFIRDLYGGYLYQLDNYLRLWPALMLFVFANALARLYPGTNFLPPEELRRMFYTTTLVFLVLAVALFLTKGGDLYSRTTFLAAWGLALISVPVMRKLMREFFMKRGWWGQAIVILGAGETARSVIQVLRDWPSMGLKPIVILDDDPAKRGELLGVPVIGPLDLAPEIARKLGIQRAVIAMPGVAREKLLKLVETHSHSFPHLLIVPDLFGFSSLWVDARDLGGVLGLELRQNLMLKSRRFMKRFFDLAFTLGTAVFSIPLMFVIALLIKLTSRGPVLFGQTRIGRNGICFTAWKFRSMCENAEMILQDYLGKHPELCAEWMRNRKLKDDPRVTWVGRLLRRTSLDELPQLWNILVGEMSLVGPRPIVADEIPKYGEFFELYSKVRPGLTGLWQVSGRNDTSYDQRVVLDTYYVRNWSGWLDIYILARTVRVVLAGKGAY